MKNSIDRTKVRFGHISNGILATIGVCFLLMIASNANAQSTEWKWYAYKERNCSGAFTSVGDNQFDIVKSMCDSHGKESYQHTLVIPSSTETEDEIVRREACVVCHPNPHPDQAQGPNGVQPIGNGPIPMPLLEPEFSPRLKTDMPLHFAEPLPTWSLDSSEISRSLVNSIPHIPIVASPALVPPELYPSNVSMPSPPSLDLFVQLDLNTYDNGAFKVPQPIRIEQSVAIE